MIFWSTLESDEEVGDELNEIRKSVETKINEYIDDIELTNSEYQDWKWAFIAICINPKFDIDFPEIARKNKKTKVLEFRLEINHKAFVESNTKKRYILFINALRRCVNHEKMDKWGFLDEDKKKLLTMLDTVEDELT